MGGLSVFALFDVDKAYGLWNGLNGQVTASDPYKGLIKKWALGEFWTVMLFIWVVVGIRMQIMRNATTRQH